MNTIYNLRYSLFDLLQIIRVLNIRKIINYFKLQATFLNYKITHKFNHKGKPFALTVEPCNYCSLHCTECPTGNNTITRKKGFLKNDLFEKIITDAEKSILYLNLYFQGEPFLNDNIFELINIAAKRNIYTSLSTNAQNINDPEIQKIIKSGLNRIIISLDGTTQEVYKNYRISGEISKVKNTVSRLVEMRKKLKSKNPLIIIQFLVTKNNEQQIEEIKQYSKQVGADILQLKTLQLIDPEKGKQLLPQNNKYSRYRFLQDGSLKLKKNKPVCWRSWSSAVITWDGHVLPCCFDKDAEFSMGNVKDENLMNIFSNIKFQNFRKKAGSIKSIYHICRNCI